MKKQCIFTILSLFLFSNVNAQYMENDFSYAEPYHDDYQSQGYHVDSYDDDEEPYGAFFLGADWLYWKTNQSNLTFGSSVTVSGGIDNIDLDNVVLKPKFEYNNGYRINLGYETTDCEWKIQASYTYLPTSARRSAFGNTDTPNPSFITLFTPNFAIFSTLAGVPFEDIGTVWKEKLNYADIDVSRTIWCCDTLQIRPHLGLRCLWSKQSFSLNADGITGVNLTSRFREKLTGVGVQGGIYGNWNVFDGLSLLGNIGGALLYSSISNDTSVSIVIADSSTTTAAYKDRNYQATPMIDGFLGIGYEKHLCNKLVNFYLGWESHLIFNTNHFSSGVSMMTLQGLTIGGGVGF